MLSSHLLGKTLSYISSQTNVIACFFQDVITPHGRGRFAVAAGNANVLGGRIIPSKLDFRNHLNAFLTDGLHDLSFLWNAWRFDD